MSRYISTLEAFVKLGSFLRDFCENRNDKNSDKYNKINDILIRAEQKNGWFTYENLIFSLEQWVGQLTNENLTHWVANYPIDQERSSKTIGIVMAGNIPLVGFHDFLCVLLTGNKVLAKLSSNDTVLLPFLADCLIEYEPSLADKIQFIEGKFEHFDAVIATGSNNTSRYFEYYFGKKPNIIRKNRNAIAIITGEESNEELQDLGKDIFKYFGLGCRNVSKIYVPSDYDFDQFFNAIFTYQDIIHQNKYANNYDYNKAVYLMSEFKILDNGFLILKEDSSFASPIASLFYERYDSTQALKQQLKEREEDIQCIVSKGMFDGEVAFGETQKPQLSDYADGVDTLKFLLEL
ncbi:acyl-CoA reductase [Flagellimonas pacifica]|uniref:Acyl-CoA reductase (LuxC) n=1 Tax=Flagellimonas pacifica TaxID=1247520 RepID=A0A285MVJ6_9FLAO|nr:acyl-CoA reductase [Allomuricauda parva]SNY99826.1 Acyl-CoA reductase (LuxC) [Allomuricauda parva]